MQISQWNQRSPRVYRYLEKEHVDDFFASGRLMLSSFARFATHADEQRLDLKEGKTFLVHRTENNGGQTLVVEMDFGHDAYVLCGSLLPSINLMSRFNTNSGIIIKDVAGFANSVAKALQGFRLGFDGPCSYQNRRIIEQDLGWLDLGPTEETDDISKFNNEVLNQTLSNLVCPDVYFLKHHSYVSQAEWRLVWLVNHDVERNILIEVPDARQFCERWDDQGVVVSF